MKIDFYIKNIELDLSALESADNANFTDEGKVYVKQAENALAKFETQYPIHDELTIAQVSYLVPRQADWVELVAKAYNEIIHMRAKCIAITTASSFSSESNPLRDWQGSKNRTLRKWHKKMERFLLNTGKKLDELMPVAAESIHKKTA